MRENSTIQQDREVGRRDCEANKYKKKKKKTVSREEVCEEARGERDESHRLEQRCCPPLAGHPVPLPAAPAG